MKTRMDPEKSIGRHQFRFEVTVTAHIIDRDGLTLGDNVGDTTLAFAANLDNVPDAASDAAINAALAHLASLPLAVIRVALELQGFGYGGEVADPMIQHLRGVGIASLRTDPVRIVVVPPAPGEGRA